MNEDHQHLNREHCPAARKKACFPVRSARSRPATRFLCSAAVSWVTRVFVLCACAL